MENIRYRQKFKFDGTTSVILVKTMILTKISCGTGNINYVKAHRDDQLQPFQLYV